MVRRTDRPHRVLTITAGDESSMRGALAREDIAVSWLDVQELDQALDLVEEAAFDAVLIDAAVGARRALTTLERLRDGRPELPVVFVTPGDDDPVWEAVAAAGADDVVGEDDLRAGMLERCLRYAVERHRLQREVASLGLADPATGLRNWRAFLAVAQHQLRVTHRYGMPVAVVVLGIEVRAEPAGPAENLSDQGARDFANIIRRSARSSDVVGRLTAGEFAVLMIDAHDGATRLVERIGREAERAASRLDRPYVVDWVAGVAEQGWRGDELLESLLDRATRSMYRARVAQRA